MERLTGLETGKISLHGLGFIQLELPANKRLHVWHPKLPRRNCYEHSFIHDHRFGFQALVLVGEQKNTLYQIADCSKDEGEFVAYSHNGPRQNWGGRPWNPIKWVRVVNEFAQSIPAGSTYEMTPYTFHSTEPGNDGYVATLMTKTVEHKLGATSLCRVGIEPHIEFDRFQLSESELWEFVHDTLSQSR